MVDLFDPSPIPKEEISDHDVVFGRDNGEWRGNRELREGEK